MKPRFDLSGLRVTGKSRGGGLLGILLDGGRLQAVALRRDNGSIHVEQSVIKPLSLDPLTDAPELVGREIRTLLDAGSLREKQVIVGLPLKWALVTQAHIPPQLPEAELPGFLQIEAERGFPCDINTLVIASSRFTTPSGERYVTLVAMPRSHIERLETVLRAAQLRPVSFSLGLTALHPPDAGDEATLVFLLSESSVALGIVAGGGLAALRVLDENTFDQETNPPTLRADVVAREARITIGQLPGDVAGSIRRVRIIGPRDQGQRLADELELRLETLNLDYQVASSYTPGELGLVVGPGTGISAPLSLAARHLAGRPPLMEFLPVRESSWQKLANKYSRGAAQRVGLAAAAAALLVGGAFLFQQWQLWRLDSRWSKMRVTVRELEAASANIKQFRPWYDESLRGMTILRRLTEAFPEDGSVTAKNLEIREPGAVTCSGVARDYQALLKTVERLRSASEIPDVSLGPTRGQTPALQFTFSFVWNEGAKHAN